MQLAYNLSTEGQVHVHRHACDSVPAAAEVGFEALPSNLEACVRTGPQTGAAAAVGHVHRRTCISHTRKYELEQSRGLWASK